MKKVISFSLWGNEEKYSIGAIKNAELALIHYPDFECWFYIHVDSVPNNIIEQLRHMPNTKIILRSGDLNNMIPMTWRFETIDDPDVEINLSRDTDTRILLREKLAVDEWLQSDKLFHIMRDHPHHMNNKTPIMGGMFGTRKIPSMLWHNAIHNTPLSDGGHTHYNKDQNFLFKCIYPLIKNNCMIHSTFGGVLNEQNIKKFPINYCKDYQFVGGYVFEDERVSKQHIDMLKRHVR